MLLYDWSFFSQTFRFVVFLAASACILYDVPECLRGHYEKLGTVCVAEHTVPQLPDDANPPPPSSTSVHPHP